MEIELGEVAVARWAADRAKLGLSAKGEARAAETIRTMLGRRFGKLQVVAYDSLRLRPDGIGAKPWWLCECDCGKRRAIKAENLLTSKGPTRSCGECVTATPAWSNFDLQQIALAVEWEGSIGVYETSSEAFTFGAYHSPRIAVGVTASTDVLLHRLQQLAKFGSVVRANSTAAAQGHRAEMAQWQVTGPEATQLATALEPFLITKYEQAQLVASYEHGAHHKPVPQEVSARRRALAVRTSELNATGPRSPPLEAAHRAERWCKDVQELERRKLLALTLDFEGCISTRFRPPYRSASFSVSQAKRRESLLTVVRQLATCGNVIQGKPDPTGRLDTVCSWAIHAQAEVTYLANEVGPHLLVKREQAEAVSSFFTSSSPAELVELVHRLNQKHQRETVDES